MWDGPSQGIPIILSLYLKPLSYSQHCFIAMNSEPKDEDSTPVCFLLHQCVNAEFKKTKKPVLDLRVAVSDAWSASTFGRIWNPKPRGSGMFLVALPFLRYGRTHSRSSHVVQTSIHQSQEHWGQIPTPCCDTSSSARKLGALATDGLCVALPGVMTSSTPVGICLLDPIPQST